MGNYISYEMFTVAADKDANTSELKSELASLNAGKRELQLDIERLKKEANELAI